MNILITDNMEKESRAWRILTILGYALALVTPVALLLLGTEQYTNKDILILTLMYFLLGSMGLYGRLYGIKYKLTITEMLISVTTLFRNFQIPICQITQYTYKRYNKTVFNQFTFFCKDGTFVIYTRCRDELIALLIKNNIPEKR